MKVRHDRDTRPVPPDVLADARVAELASWGRRLAEEGLSPGQSGNMSFRVPPGFLVTRTGVPLGAVETDDWVLVTGVWRNGRGEVVVSSRGVNEPSKDSAVHAAVYAARPDAATVFHFHVGALDVLTGRLGVPSTSTYHPAGTRESMEEIQGFLRDHPGVCYFVLVDHGIVSLGGSAEQAGTLVESHRMAVEGET